MTVKDALCRGANLFAVTTLAVLSTSSLPHVFADVDLAEKWDDITVVALAGIGICWYSLGRNRFEMTLAPFLFLGLAAAAKLIAVYLAEATIMIWSMDTVLAVFLLLFACAFLVQYAMLVDRQRRRRKRIHGYWS